MTRNVGTADRILRGILGVLILGLYGAMPGPFKYVILLGLIPLGTALTGNCPLYTLMGWSTASGRSALRSR